MSRPALFIPEMYLNQALFTALNNPQTMFTNFDVYSFALNMNAKNNFQHAF